MDKNQQQGADQGLADQAKEKGAVALAAGNGEQGRQQSQLDHAEETMGVPQAAHQPADYSHPGAG